MKLQQKFQKEDGSDKSLQQTGVVELMICAIMKDGTKVPLFCNEARNSYRSVRPIHYKFQKESTETNVKEGARLEKEMNDLLNDPYEPDDFPNIEVNFIGFITMIDGKVCFTVVIKRYSDPNLNSLFQKYHFNSNVPNPILSNNSNIIF